MGLDINTNTMANVAAANLSESQMAEQNSLQKLSSGYAINKAADDATGLVISQHLQAQIGGFQQAQANTQNAINVVQTADGALNEVSNILQRVRTLAVQAANTTVNDSTAQAAAQAEATQSLTAIDQIVNSTVYGSNQLLSSSGTSSFTFQVGYGTTGGQVTFSLSVTTGLSASSLIGTAIASFQITGSNAISTIDAAISTVSSTRASLGAYQNEFQHIANNETVMTQNLQASKAQILDTNMASEMVNFTQKQILVQAGVSMLSQANSTSQSVLKLLG
jgi:flagellin